MSSRLGTEYDEILQDVTTNLRLEKLVPPNSETTARSYQLLTELIGELKTSVYNLVTEAPVKERQFFLESITENRIIGTGDASQNEHFNAVWELEGYRTLVYFQLHIRLCRDPKGELPIATSTVYVALRSLQADALNPARFKAVTLFISWMQQGLLMALDRQYLANFVHYSLSSIPVGYLLVVDEEVYLANKRASELLGLSQASPSQASPLRSFTLKELFGEDVRGRLVAGIKKLDTEGLNRTALAFWKTVRDKKLLLKAVLNPLNLLDVEEIGFMDEVLKRRFTKMVGMVLVDVTDEILLDRLEGEIAFARTAQQRLLPDLDKVHGPFKVAAKLVAATEVGGDSYDILTDAQGRYWFVVTDVSGHGLDSSLVSSFMKGSFHTLLRQNVDLIPMLKLQDQVMALLKTWAYTTAAMVVLDPRSLTATFGSAGHPPPFLVREASGEVIEIETLSRPLGLTLGKSIEFTERTVKLAPGDTIFLYTDGVVERMNHEDEPFGYERLAALIEHTASAGPVNLLDELAAALEQHSAGRPLTDDWTALAIKINAEHEHEPVDGPFSLYY